MCVKILGSKAKDCINTESGLKKIDVDNIHYTVIFAGNAAKEARIIRK